MNVPQITTFEYDRANRLRQRTDPEGHTFLFEYDAAGNLTAEIDARLSRTAGGEVPGHSEDEGIRSGEVGSGMSPAE
jgi:YD repeat-containing protein